MSGARAYECRGFEAMSDEDLKAVGVIAQLQYEATGSRLWKQEADAVADEQARRMAAAPNPYEGTNRAESTRAAEE